MGEFFRLPIPVGEIDSEIGRLLTVTQEALRHAVGPVRVGNRISDVSRAVETHVTSSGLALSDSLSATGLGHLSMRDPRCQLRQQRTVAKDSRRNGHSN